MNPVARAWSASRSRRKDHHGSAILAPAGPDHLEVAGQPLDGLAPGVVLRPGEPGAAIDEDERRGALRVGGREDEGHHRRADAGHQGGPFGADVVEDRPKVVDPLLDRRQVVDADRVGQAGATLVEDDDATERRQLVEQPGKGREVPHGIDVAEPLVDEDEVGRAVSEHLVGDVELAGARVARLWDRDRIEAHGPSVAAWPKTRNILGGVQVRGGSEVQEATPYDPTRVSSVATGGSSHRPSISAVNALNATNSLRMRPGWSVSNTTCMKLTPSGSLNVA